MKVAIIGVGRMGERHISVVKKLGMEIVGLFDQNDELVLNVASKNKLNLTNQCKDISQLYNKQLPDAVVVSTTAPSHYSYVCEAAKAGVRYILCEKPMAVSINEAQTMSSICKNNDSLLAINHQMRFMDNYCKIRSLANSIEFGGVVSIILSGSNCGLAMNGSHYFELLRFISGENAETVCAWFDNDLVPNPRGANFEDRGGKVRAVTASGISMYLDISVKAGHGLQLILICKHGQIILDELTGYVRSISRSEKNRNLPTTQYGSTGINNVFQIEPSNVITSTENVWYKLIEGNGYPDADTGIHALCCLAAAYTSNKNGNISILLEDPRIDCEVKYPWS